MIALLIFMLSIVRIIKPEYHISLEIFNIIQSMPIYVYLLQPTKSIGYLWRKANF